MKARYLSLVITSVLSSHVFASDLQQLATAQVEEKMDNEQQITAVELENTQANDVRGILKKFAGISVSNSARYSQKTYIRGVEEHSANVTIDGARQDGQLFHHSANQMIDPFMLKAVTVELGATSALSGYGANVGAISYETKDPTDLLAPEQKFGFIASASADTATEYQAVNASGYGMLTNKLSVLAMLGWNESGDIETPDADPIVNKHTEMKSGLVKVVYDFSNTEQLDFSVQRYDDGGHRALSGEKPGVTSLSEALGFNGMERDTYTLSYSNNHENPLLDLSANLYLNGKRLVRSPESGDNWWLDLEGKWHKDGTAETPEQEFSYKTLGFDIRNNFIINDITWTAGLEGFQSEQSISVDGFKEVTGSDGTKYLVDLNVTNGPEASLVGAYLQAELALGDFTVIPAIRYDDYSLGGAYDSSFEQLSPKLEVNWQVNQDLLAKFGYGRIFKGPGLPETMLILEGMTQSADAKAETGNHIEFNIIQDFQDILNVDNASAYANIYHYTIDNSYHPTKNWKLTRGIYDLTMYGLEAGFSLSHQALTTYINYSYNSGENAFDTYTTDNYYSGTHIIKLAIDYQFTESLLVGWNSEFAKGAELDNTSIEKSGDISTEQISKAGYGIHNLWLDYQVLAVDGLSFKLALENVFDKAYQYHNSWGMFWGNPDKGDNEVGRNAKFSVSYQF